jgi:adenylate cyclase
VEGSVRKSGDRVRVTAQLIDAVAGAHLWADRYDRQLEDIFEVQDDVVRAVVAVLPGRIAEAGAEWVRRKPTDNLTAFDYLLRGQHELARRGNGIRNAIGHYQRAIEIDADCAAAYAGIAVAEGMSVWDLSTYDDNPLERAYEAAKKALELDPSDAARDEAQSQQHTGAGILGDAASVHWKTGKCGGYLLSGNSPGSVQSGQSEKGNSGGILLHDGRIPVID